MAVDTLAVPNLATEPGFLFRAPLGSDLPAGIVQGGVFTDSWTKDSQGGDTPWQMLGATEEGSNFSWSTTVEAITAAEFAEPLKFVTTGRTGSISFALLSISVRNMKIVMNGGQVVTTGAGPTLKTRYTPPKLGQEVRCMIGWESVDQTERLIAYQCISGGEVSIQRRKGTAKANLPATFNLEMAYGQSSPWEYQTAGEGRAA